VNKYREGKGEKDSVNGVKRSEIDAIS